MSELLNPTPGFLFGSFLYNKNHHDKDKLLSLWREKYGDGYLLSSPLCPMMQYYSSEMGDVEELERFWFFSSTPVEREELLGAKLWSDALEREYMQDNKRSLNLDSGMLSLENLVLATGKSYAHRTYLSDGVYLDLTLQFCEKTFSPLPWTYPDYKDPEVIDFINLIRGVLLLKIKNLQ